MKVMMASFTHIIYSSPKLTSKCFSLLFIKYKEHLYKKGFPWCPLLWLAGHILHFFTSTKLSFMHPRRELTGTDSDWDLITSSSSSYTHSHKYLSSQQWRRREDFQVKNFITTSRIFNVCVCLKRKKQTITPWVI